MEWKVPQGKTSTIVAVAYIEDEETLSIRFNDNSVYEYFDVPEEIYEDLLESLNTKQYFMQNIKGKFKYEKV